MRTPELAGYLAMNPGRGRLWPELLSSPPPGLFAGFVTGKREQMLELEDVLHRELPGKLHAHVLRSPRYFGFFLEVAPVGVTKWSGVLHLAEKWGISAGRNLRRRRRHERHPDDPRRGPGRCDGQRPAGGQGRRRPRCAQSR